MKTLCQRAKEILIEESNVQNVESPVTVSTLSSSSRHLFDFFLMFCFMAKEDCPIDCLMSWENIII